MNNRLRAVYSLIKDGKGIIDVGTDHGYIPAELAQRGYPGRIIASDINEGPLLSAKSTAESKNVGQKIEFMLCDGLEQCDCEAVDTIVVAGMGGDTVCGILDRAEWCMDERYTLILQPMTKSEVLRFWLANNGFDIECENLVKDGGIIYQIITARFGNAKKLSDSECFTGRFELIKNEQLFPEYLNMLILRFNSVILGLRKADMQNSGRIRFYSEIFKELCKMRALL